MKTSSRVFGLDILRAWAILNVVIMHGGAFTEGTFLEGFPYINMIDGVDIFFALSGYLIGKLLLREINEKGTFTFKDLFTFWKRRWFRTLPNYYLILLANYLVVKYGIIHEYISAFNWKFIFFLQNFSSPFMGFFWESWTLTIEEWFYIFAPLILLLMLRFFKPRRAFLITTLLMIMAPLLHRASIYNPGIDGNQWSEIYRKLVINRLDSIAYGLLGAWLFYYCCDFWRRVRYIGVVAGFGLMYFILHYNASVQTFYAQVIQLMLSPLSAMLLLPMAESIKEGKGVLARVITHISVISYSMYLINAALVAEVIRDNFAPTTYTTKVITYFAFWLAVVFFSTLIYRFYEKPMMDLRDKEIKLPSLFKGQNKQT